MNRFRIVLRRLGDMAIYYTIAGIVLYLLSHNHCDLRTDTCIWKTSSHQWVLLILLFFSFLVAYFVKRKVALPKFINLFQNIWCWCARPKWNKVFFRILWRNMQVLLGCLVKNVKVFLKIIVVFLDLFWYATVFPSTIYIIISGFIISLIYSKEIFLSEFSLNYELLILLIPFSLPLILLAAEWIAAKIPQKKKNAHKASVANHKNKKSKDILTISDAEFLDWINGEKESVDYFNILPVYEERLYTHIVNDGNLLLFGDFGIGKTTLLNLLEQRLHEEKPNEYIFCKIDSWGRNIEALPKQILSKIIYEISAFVDVTHLHGVPESYLHALAKYDSKVASFLQFGLNSYKPEDLIEKIDDVLRIIRKKVVLIIEDIDRNNSPEKSLLVVEQLLDRMKESYNIQYITTVSKSTIVDQEANRFFDHKMTLLISPENLSSAFKKFEQYLWKTYKNSFICPYRDEEKEKKKDSRNNEYTYLTELLNTPRQIKRAFNQIWQIWKKLKGEVELNTFIDLMIINDVSFQTYIYLISSNNLQNLTPKSGDIARDSIPVDGGISEDKQKKIRNLAMRINGRSQNARQSFFKERYRRIIQTLDVDDYSDQRILKLGQLYFEKEKKSAQDVVQEIDSNDIYERLFPLWEKYIYKDRKEDQFAVASDSMSQKVLSLITVMIQDILGKSKGIGHVETTIAQMFSPIFGGVHSEQQQQRDRDLLNAILKELYKLQGTKDGLKKANSLFQELHGPYVGNPYVNVFDYLEFFKNKAEDTPDLVEKIINNNPPNTIFEFLFSFPSEARERSFSSDQIITVTNGNGLLSFERELIAWLLDGIASLAERGNEYAQQALLCNVLFHFSGNKGKIHLGDSKKQEKYEPTDVEKEQYKHLLTIRNLNGKNIRNFKQLKAVIMTLYPDSSEDILELIITYTTQMSVPDFKKLLSPVINEDTAEYWYDLLKAIKIMMMQEEQ